ncbi:cobalamin biosynthesis family protein [Vibrio caribbeanicus]|uniref:cobalamin biosynthesis family protein n=1 Tax=Vibrio caribbeanicus TaxID=701175 RepID=UPI0030DD04D8
MEGLFNDFYSNGALLILWAGLLVHRLLPLSREFHPTTIWRKFAIQLSNKVNTSTTASQAMLSGSLAWLLMMLPLFVVAISLGNLAWYQEVFELTLLVFALDWRNTDRFGKDFVTTLAREDKTHGKILIQPLINRSTASFSMVGLGKAGSETLIMSYGRNLVCVLFWYGLTGGVGAFLYRMAVELSRAWSPSRKQYSSFGQMATRTVALTELVPMRLFALLITSGRRALATIQLIKLQASSWPLPGPAWLMVSVGAKLQLSLGGPAIYDRHKSIRTKVGGRIAPSAIHVAQVHQLLKQKCYLWVLAQSVIMGLVYQGL